MNSLDQNSTNGRVMEEHVTRLPVLPGGMDQNNTFIVSQDGKLNENGLALPSDHSNIQGAHSRTLVNIGEFFSKEQSFKHDDSWRFSRELSLQFQHCPACTSKDITFYGKSEVGTQRYRCKQCKRQFVCQMDSIYPKLIRRDIFYREFDQQKHKYWKPAVLGVLSYVESHRGRLLINRILSIHFDGKITSQREYDVLTFFIIHEIYNIIMAR